MTRSAARRKALRVVGGVVVALFVAVVASWAYHSDWFRPRMALRPLVVAHRAGSGLWPQNSRSAVKYAVDTASNADPATRFGGIEIDIVLTSDEVPVLSHDPWIHRTLCRTTAGREIDDRILIRDIAFADLQSGYRCGGERDPSFPDVTPVAESPMSLDEVLTELRRAPEMALYLDVKVEVPLTPPAAAAARAIGRRWIAARLPNRLLVEAPLVADAVAYRGAGLPPASIVRSVPTFHAEEKGAWTVAKAWLASRVGLLDPVAQARAAGVEAVVGPTQLFSWPMARSALDNGISVVLFAPNTRDALDRYCGWPVAVLITDYPNLGGCPPAATR